MRRAILGFGFWLYDRVIGYGAECIVTPPSLLPLTKDRAMRQKYERIKSRSGAKRAIVAISRMLLDGRPYVLELAGWMRESEIEKNHGLGYGVGFI